MYCQKCGKQIDDEAVMCPGCGAMVYSHYRTYAPKASPNKRSDRGTWQIIVGLILIVCGASSFMMGYIQGDAYTAYLAIIWLVAGCGLFAYGCHCKKVIAEQEQPDAIMNNGPALPVEETAVSDTMEEPEAKPKLPQFEFHKIRLVGVTFRNEDGTNRQTILRKFRFRDPPFDGKEANVEMVPYEYEGAPAMAVEVNGLRLGNIPKERARYLNENMHRIIGVTWIDIIGGGETDEGNPLNYGAEVTVKLRKE